MDVADEAYYTRVFSSVDEIDLKVIYSAFRRVFDIKELRNVDFWIWLTGLCSFLKMFIKRRYEKMMMNTPFDGKMEYGGR